MPKCNLVTVENAPKLKGIKSSLRLEGEGFGVNVPVGPLNGFAGGGEIGGHTQDVDVGGAGAGHF